MKATNLFIIIWAIMSCQVWGQSEKAVELYEEALEENKVGRLVNASVLLTNAISESPEFAEAYYQRALSFQGMGQTSHAIQDLEKAVELKINNIGAYLLLLRLYKDEESFDQALSVTNRILEDLPENAVGAYYDQALIYEEMMQFSDAINAYRQSLKRVEPGMEDFAASLEKSIQRLESKRKSN